VLVFYPADFTPVCGSELAIFSEILPDIEGLGARLFAISCDSVFSHRAFAAQMNLTMPLLSDFHPKGEASRRYRVYSEDFGSARGRCSCSTVTVSCSGARSRPPT